MDTLTRLKASRFFALYDEFGDVLYLSDGEPREALTSADEEEFIWREDRKTRTMIGVTIMDFRFCWQHKSAELAKKLRVGLRISENEARRMAIELLAMANS